MLPVGVPVHLIVHRSFGELHAERVRLECGRERENAPRAPLWRFLSMVDDGDVDTALDGQRALTTTFLVVLLI